ncbi:MAG: ATP-binding cassette domain-containing protein [Solirubrobacteraceae bacterium]
MRNIDLEVAEGEVFGFLGPNGAGKTTTVRMLCTLLPPTAGTARVAGIDGFADPAGVRRRIGVALHQMLLLFRGSFIRSMIAQAGGAVSFEWEAFACGPTQTPRSRSCARRTVSRRSRSTVATEPLKSSSTRNCAGLTGAV